MSERPDVSMPSGELCPISVVVPTYRRERVLCETLDSLLRQMRAADELLVIDQTEEHEPETKERIERLAARCAIRWFRQQPPSITGAMNRGLLEAAHDVVLFVDDDIRPAPSLLSAHRTAHAMHSNTLIAGRVIQPWDTGGRSTRTGTSAFAGSDPGVVDEFIGCNFSVGRSDALAIGGFDENFVQVAYRFEAEFASRFRAAGGVIRFEPLACLHHLRVNGGGTRSYGDHLTTMKPAHAVGAYYFAISTRPAGRCVRECLVRLFQAIATRHHLRRPWWIPATLSAELRGLWWALRLHGGGPRLIGTARDGS